MLIFSPFLYDVDCSYVSPIKLVQYLSLLISKKYLITK